MSRDIYNIIFDYFCGKVTDEDRKTLDSWLSGSPENQQIFNEYEKVWKITGRISENVNPDINEEWERFKTIREQKKDTKTIKFNPVIFRIAAVLIPAVIILGILYFSSHKKSETWITVVSTNDRVKRTLPDGSVVTLNKNSSLSYQKKYGKKERKVRLAGEAYFEVKKSEIPFIAVAGETSVKVVGTKFSIRNYKEEKNTEVIVEEGKVLFAGKSSEHFLNKGENAIYSEGKIIKNNKTTLNNLAWVKERLVFNETQVKDLNTDISRYFGKTFIIPEKLNKCLFTGEFYQPTLKEFMEIFSTALEFYWTEKNDTVIITNGSCEE